MADICCIVCSALRIMPAMITRLFANRLRPRWTSSATCLFHVENSAKQAGAHASGCARQAGLSPRLKVPRGSRWRRAGRPRAHRRHLTLEVVGERP